MVAVSGTQLQPPGTKSHHVSVGLACFDRMFSPSCEQLKNMTHTLFLSVVWWDEFVRWFLGGTFRPRTDENDWCRQFLRESNKAADTHANWLMDNGDSGPGAQWMAPNLHDRMQKSRHIVLSFDGARRESGLGAAAWILWLRDEYGSFEKVSYGGRVLRNAPAMIAEREALKMGIEHLTVLFPTEVSSFDFQVECTDRTVQ